MQLKWGPKETIYEIRPVASVVKCIAMVNNNDPLAALEI